MESRDIGSTRIAKLAIDLIREEEKVIFLHQISQLVHLFLGVKITGRIVGVTNQDGFRTRCDQLLKTLKRRQRKTFVNRRRDGLDYRTTGNGKGHVVGIGRLWHDNLITGIQAGHEREEDSLRSACRDDDIVSRDMDIELVVILDQLLAETTNAFTGRILQHLPIYSTHRLQGNVWSGQIRLTDI